MLPKTYKDIERDFQHPDDVRVLLNDLHVEIETDKEIIIVDLKKGFMTDFGSVPKAARSVIPHDGLKYLIAYIVHDALYGGNYGFTYSNKLLKEMLRFTGVALRKLYYVFWPVSFFGKDKYKKSQYRINKDRQFINLVRHDK